MAWSRTPYQLAALKAARSRRCFILLWRRQGRKSSTLAEVAIDAMTANPGRLVVYASASLLLGREIIHKESMALNRVIAQVKKEASANIELADRSTEKTVKNISEDDFADLFETQRLELRIRIDRTTVSRTQIIAPNPATARGWSGTVLLDEFGFIRDFRELWEAVEPITSTDPDFRLILATTPPSDDAHYSYEITNPPPGTEFPVNPAGNWYRSEGGKIIHRVDIHDAHTAGVPLYDLETGKVLTPQEHFQRADDKDAWRRNYAVQHVLGGASACGLPQLDSAQSRGHGNCAYFHIETPEDLANAVDFIHLNTEKQTTYAFGWDLATTERETSNPSSLTLLEKHGAEYTARAIFTWKTTDPARAKHIVTILISCLYDVYGCKGRKLCIDATNERYFAAEVKKELSFMLPIELVVGSETIERPGYESMTMKQYLGSLLVSALDDNRLTLPPERYIREDFRLVKKERGMFVCQPDAAGRHGDTFDSTKLALYALGHTSGAWTAETVSKAIVPSTTVSRKHLPKPLICRV